MEYIVRVHGSSSTWIDLDKQHRRYERKGELDLCCEEFCEVGFRISAIGAITHYSSPINLRNLQKLW